MIRNASEFLAIIDQQKAFLKRKNLPVKHVEQLETLVIGQQISMCNKQKEVMDYFKSFSEGPKPKDRFKLLNDVSADITIVESLSNIEMESMDLDSVSINAMIA